MISEKTSRALERRWRWIVAHAEEQHGRLRYVGSIASMADLGETRSTKYERMQKLSELGCVWFERTAENKKSYIVGQEYKHRPWVPPAGRIAPANPLCGDSGLDRTQRYRAGILKYLRRNAKDRIWEGRVSDIPHEGYSVDTTVLHIMRLKELGYIERLAERKIYITKKRVN